MFNVTLFDLTINATSFIRELTLSVVSVSQNEINNFQKKLDLILLVLFKLVVSFEQISPTYLW